MNGRERSRSVPKAPRKGRLLQTKPSGITHKKKEPDPNRLLLFSVINVMNVTNAT